MKKIIVNFSILFSLFFSENLFAACGLTPASCSPNTLSYCCNFGITNVTFNTINHSSSDGSDGYMDSTCLQTNVLEGQVYPLSITTNALSTQNYAVWIDFNNDGVLNDLTERVLTISSQLNTSGNIAIPIGATLNTPLRMRISADYDLSEPPTSCSDLEFGQAEDYGIIIESNTNPPEPIFEADVTTSCNGTVCFTDKSLNLPTGWLWDFGDGTTSFLQNPCHNYNSDGTYTIKLTATNANGSNIDSIVNYVTVNTAGQVTPSSCNPSTLAYCCDYGIYEVSFNTINKTSGNGSEGYQDFSCSNSTTITEGNTYLLSIETGPSNVQDTRAWIDYNNDGVFNNSNELILDASGISNPSQNILIPGSAILNTPLRMRISSDIVGTTQSACDDNDFGQTEDYSVMILPTTSSPKSNFSATPRFSCNDSIRFKDLSTNAPTSWRWSFGDGSTSSLKNPVHYYTDPGNYSVSLVAINKFGQDSTSFQDYLIVCASTLPAISGDSTSACSGRLFDNGQLFPYSSNTDGSLSIHPPGASEIILNFVSFSFTQAFANGDFLYIHDGPTRFSPVIKRLSGNSLPAEIKSTGGSITIRQETKNSGIVSDGFELTWSCNSSVDVKKYDLINDQFIIYPNPTKGIINIKSNDSDMSDVKDLTLFNAMGKTVMKKLNLSSTNEIQLNISHLSKGLYFLEIKKEEGSSIQKINLH